MKYTGKNLCRSVSFFLLLAVLLCFIPTATGKAYTIKSGQSIYDDAELLTQNEIDNLNAYLQEVASRWNIDIFILTTNNNGGYSSEDYIDHFKEEACNQKQLFRNDCVLLLINMADREVSISGYGICENQIPNSRATSIREDITPDLTAGNYYDACYSFIQGTDTYMGKDLFYFQVWFQLLVACGIGGLIVTFMAISRGTPVTTNSNTYLDHEHSKLRFHHDNYIRTVVTKTRKPENNSGSSGHGGGGGGSHSNSTGKF